MDSFRYAQMQSSILNKTGLSSSSLTSGSKINLKSKFSTIELSATTIESDTRKLITDTNVKIWVIFCRNQSDMPNN